MHTTTQQDTAVVRDIYDAFARGDFPRITELVHPEVVITQSPVLPWGGTHVGHQGLAHFLGTLTSLVDPAAETELLFADGAGRVVQVGRTRGTVRATGARFDVPEVHVWTVREGRAVAYEAYLETDAMLRALAADAPCDGGEPVPVPA